MFRSPARLVTASLLLASAAAFATGVTIERATASSESHRVVAAATPGQARGGDGDGGETGTTSPAEAAPGSDEHSPARTATTTPSTGEARTAESQSENLLGINPEATALVVIAVALSLLLAALILTVGSPLVAVGVAVTMLAFTVLDIREVTHQLNESRSLLAALAAVAALLHLLAAVSALGQRHDKNVPSGRQQPA